MRKIWILVLAICMFFFSSQVFWYFENYVYCDFSGGNVTVFLKNEWWKLKCQNYLDSIYQLSIKKYEEISTIRSYINQWWDIYYWRQLLEQKKTEFVQLVNYKVQVKTAVDKFESILFDKYYDILEWPMKNYYTELESEYYKLLDENGGERSASNTRLSKLEQQMTNVRRILKAQKLDEIIEVCSSYLYLKNRLGWK